MKNFTLFIYRRAKKTVSSMDYTEEFDTVAEAEARAKQFRVEYYDIVSKEDHKNYVRSLPLAANS